MQRYTSESTKRRSSSKLPSLAIPISSSLCDKKGTYPPFPLIFLFLIKRWNHWPRCDWCLANITHSIIFFLSFSFQIDFIKIIISAVGYSAVWSCYGW